MGFPLDLDSLGVSTYAVVVGTYTSTCKRPSTLDVESQRGPEFIHVKSQCYLQKLPLFNS